MRIVIDLDGTICELRREGQTYDDLSVNRGAVERIRKLKELGHYIIIQTARHMETCNSNLGLVNAKIAKNTIEWLEKNKIPFDEIYFGKPNADIYIDDNAKTFIEWDDLDYIEKYDEKVINLVIPMAGAGSRFIRAGYNLPKPLIDVMGRKMFEWAVSSFDFLKGKYDLNYIFIVLQEHIEKYGIDDEIRKICKDANIIGLDQITRGQAETALMAKKYINNLNKLIIFNSDTYTIFDENVFPIENKKIDGIISCFKSNDARYSYVRVDEYGYVREVAEKVVISDNATNGMYYFRRGVDFVNYAEKMIENNELNNGEFYVGPVYNHLINSGKRIKMISVKENWILGTPEELIHFLDGYK